MKKIELLLGQLSDCWRKKSQCQLYPPAAATVALWHLELVMKRRKQLLQQRRQLPNCWVKRLQSHTPAAATAAF